MRPRTRLRAQTSLPEPRFPHLSNGVAGTQGAGLRRGGGAVGLREARERQLPAKSGSVRVRRGGGRGRCVAGVGARLPLVGAGPRGWRVGGK